MKNLCKLFVCFTIFLAFSQIVFAKSNILQKITISNTLNGYSLKLDVLNDIKTVKEIKNDNQVDFEVYSTSLSDNFETQYDTNGIDNIVVSLVSNDKIKISVYGKNAKNTNISLNINGNNSVSTLVDKVNFKIALIFGLLFALLLGGMKVYVLKRERMQNQIFDRFNYIPSFDKNFVISNMKNGNHSIPFKKNKRNDDFEYKKSKIA